MVDLSRTSFRSRSVGLCAALFAWAYLAIFGAAAGTFPIPPDHPAARIDVPDDWRPMSIGGRVEGSASTAVVRLAIQFIPGSDLDAASAAATTKLARSGVAVALHARIDPAGWSFRPPSGAQVLQRPHSADLWDASVIFSLQTLAASAWNRRPISQGVRRTLARIAIRQRAAGWQVGQRWRIEPKIRFGG
jgi:hypothetical protein